jgi:hypothetical protein
MSSPKDYANEKEKPLGYAEGLDSDRDSERASFTELIAEGGILTFQSRS